MVIRSALLLNCRCRGFVILDGEDFTVGADVRSFGMDEAVVSEGNSPSSVWGVGIVGVDLFITALRQLDLLSALMGSSSRIAFH